MKFPAIKPILFRKKTSVTALSGNLPEKKFKHLVVGSLFLLITMFGSGYYLLFKLVKSDAARNMIVTQLEQATGREVSLKGDINLALSWKPTFKINGVTIANADGAKAPYFLSIEKLLFTLDLLPLLQRQISVTELELDRPIVYLEKNEASVNWKFEPQNKTTNTQDKQPKEKKSSSKPLAISLQKITLQNGELRYHDPVTEQKQELLLTSMKFTNHSLKRKSSANIQGYYQNTPFVALLKADSLRSLVQQSSDTALTLALNVGNNILEADGIFSWQESAEEADKPAKQMSFTGSLQGLLTDSDAIAKVSGVQIPEMGDINFSSIGTFSPQAIKADKLSLKSQGFQLNGNATLSLEDKDINKILKNIVLEGNISDLAFLKPFLGENKNIPVAPGYTSFSIKAETEQNHLKFSKLNIKSNNISLQANNLKTRLPQNNSPLEINGRISLQSRDLGSLIKEPGYAERTLKLNGVLAIKEKDIALEDLVLSTLNSQITGSAGVILPTNKNNIPSISFDLTTPKIFVADLLPEEKPNVTQKNINNKLFSDTPLNLLALKKVNGQGTLSIGSLHLPVKDDKNTPLIFDKIETSLSSQNGNLKFDNLSFDLPGSGSISGTAGLNANSKTAALSTNLQVSKLILGKSLQHFGFTNIMEQGSVNLNLKLNASGNSMSSLAANANGLVGVNMKTARLGKANVEQMNNEIVKNLISLASNNQATTVNCLVSRWSIKNGIATTDLTIIDTTHIAMQGTGSINLGKETLDIVIAPRPKNLGQLNVSAPITINGSLRRPKISSNLDHVADNLISDLVRGELNPQAIIGTFVDPDGNYQTCGSPNKQNANNETTIKNESVPKLSEKKQELESQGRKLLEDAIKLLPGWKN
ncbi:MAG: AsmA family protein [Cyanobacteria bacterium P01_E01_bin.35]